MQRVHRWTNSLYVFTVSLARPGVRDFWTACPISPLSFRISVELRAVSCVAVPRWLLVPGMAWSVQYISTGSHHNTLQACQNERPTWYLTRTPSILDHAASPLGRAYPNQTDHASGWRKILGFDEGLVEGGVWRDYRSAGKYRSIGSPVRRSSGELTRSVSESTHMPDVLYVYRNPGACCSLALRISIACLHLPHDVPA